jgi:tight adherence protein C
LGALARRARLLGAGQTEAISEKLLRAGLRSQEAVAIFFAAKCLAPVVFAVGALMLPPVIGLDLSGSMKLLSAVLAAALGFFSPDIFLANRAAKRKQALEKALPDGLDLLVICAEAGLTLDTALHRVAEEVARSSPELADELTVTSVELNFLPNRRSALLNLVRRVDLPTMRGVVNTLIQTERYGTPLAHALRVLSAEFREQRMLRAEEKAAKLPATLTVPMIVFILPTLFIVLIGPAVLDVWQRMTG